MLESIKITNLALISKSSVNFGEGFNVLTGETGAGKSLIVDALLFLTGVRADKTLIKSGEEFARVEGVFFIDSSNPTLNEVLSSVDIENEGTLIISRYFSVSNKNECRINGEVVTLNILRKVANCILDIFGQNDSQILLDSKNHLRLLDEIIEDKLQEHKLSLASELSSLSLINSQIKELGGLDRDRENNIRLIQFEIDEIDDAKLYDGEEEELKDRLTKMQNSEKIFTSLSQVIDGLDGEYNVSSIMKTAINTLTTLERLDSDISNEKERLLSVKYEFDDIVSSLNSNLNNLSYSQEELDMAQDRLSDIKDLERKYGSTIKDVLEHREKLSDRLDILLNADEQLSKLKEEKCRVLRRVYELCLTLREIRQQEFVGFRKRLLSELRKLGMKNADFGLEFQTEISLDNIEELVGVDGADKVEFLFSANLGVEPRSLTKIISGGEMSRFMLAFKSLQSAGQGKTCIFDEIDTGIGGEIGRVVGEKICEISRTNQVICITHLPQIASFGDQNFKIEKYEEGDRTITSVRLLNSDDKVAEIARMIGSSSNSTAIMHAREIISDANTFKLLK